MTKDEYIKAFRDYANKNRILDDMINNLCRVSLINLINICNNNSIIPNKPADNIIDKSLIINSRAVKKSYDPFQNLDTQVQRMAKEVVNELSDDLAKKAEKVIIENLLSSTSIITETSNSPVQDKNNGSLLDKIKEWLLHVKKQIDVRVRKPMLIIDSSLYRDIYDEEKYCIEKKQVYTKWENLLDVEQICESNDFPPVNQNNSKPAINIIAIDPLRLHFQLYLSPIFDYNESGTTISFIESLYIYISGRDSKNVLTGSIAH